MKRESEREEKREILYFVFFLMRKLKFAYHFFLFIKPGPPQVLNEVSSRFISVERGDDAVIRAVFCADPRPIRVSWRWAAFQMEAGSGSGRFVAEALHKVSPAILPTPPAIVELVGEDEDDDDDVMGNTESSNTNSAYDTAIIESTSTSSTMHHPRSLEVVPTAQSLVARLPQAVFTYPVHINTLTHPSPGSYRLTSPHVLLEKEGGGGKSCLLLP